MRDAINLTAAGQPVVLFVFDCFERAARAQARVLGMADLPIYVYPQYAPGAGSDALEEQKAARAAAEFPRLLVPAGN